MFVFFKYYFVYKLSPLSKSFICLCKNKMLTKENKHLSKVLSSDMT